VTRHLALFLAILLLGLTSPAFGGELQGRIDTFELAGAASGMEAEVKVYLPPGYDDAKEAFSAMYFLHGSGGVTGIGMLAAEAPHVQRIDKFLGRRAS